MHARPNGVRREVMRGHATLERLADFRRQKILASPMTDGPTDPLLAYEGDVQDVAATPAGFYAVGYRDTDFGTAISVFYSGDGRAWLPHSTFSTRAPERVRPLAITSTGARLVVAGVTVAGPADDGRIWTYDDVQGWVRVDPTPLGMSGPGFQNVGDVAWDPALGLVAGGASSNGNVESPTLWHSASGEAWERCTSWQ